VKFEGLPAVVAIFYGVSPAVIALILHSRYRLTKLGMKGLAGVGARVFIACGFVGLLYYGSLFRGRQAASTTSLMAVPLVAATQQGGFGSILGKLLTFFLKAGSLTFGSGLVIVPFLEKGLVQQTGWLDQREFLVAVAMGMISRGPSSSRRRSSATSSPRGSVAPYSMASGGPWSRRSASSCRHSSLSSSWPQIGRASCRERV